MMLDRLGWRICAGVLFAAAASGGNAAEATQVYPGCAIPPTTFNHVWYIDPVNGQTQASGGDGSRAHPWNSLQALFTLEPGYSTSLLSTAPYYHPNPNPGGNRVWVGPPLGPVNPGDEILLMSGNYGDINIGYYNLGVNNPSFVSIAAAPGQTPVLSTLSATASSYFSFSGIKVQSVADGSRGSNTRGLVQIADRGPSLPSSNFVFTNMLVESADDTSAWTRPQWLSQVRAAGIFAKGGDQGADTTCVSVTNSHIRNVIFGAIVMANNMLFSDNEIDRFGDDGIDYAASNLLISKNYIHDDLDLGNGAHMDGMQGYPGSYNNVTIDRNRVIRQTDPKLQFPTYLQGIDAFDGDWANLTVTNNAIVTSACHGISFGSVHGGKFINNTVVSDGLIPQAGNCKPGVGVGDKTHQGSSSNDVVIRNNLANGLAIYNVNPNMVMDHNICATIQGGCGVLTFLPDGKPKWGVYKPGTYGDHNIIDPRGNEGEFVNFDPANLVFDMRLRTGARAIGAGSPDGAPPVDITGAARGIPVDAGAYRYVPGK